MNIHPPFRKERGEDVSAREEEGGRLITNTVLGFFAMFVERGGRSRR